MLLSNQFLLPLQEHAAQSLMLDPQHLLFSQTTNHTTTCHNSVKRNQFLLPLQEHAAQSLMLDPQHLLFSQTANHTTACHNSVKRNLLIGKLTRILCNTTS